MAVRRGPDSLQFYYEPGTGIGERRWFRQWRLVVPTSFQYRYCLTLPALEMGTLVMHDCSDRMFATLNEPEFHERRRRPRFALDLEARYFERDRERRRTTEPARTLNLSSKGLCLQASHVPAAGAPIDVRVHWPTGEELGLRTELRIHGIVCWSQGHQMGVRIFRSEFAMLRSDPASSTAAVPADPVG